MQLKFFIAAFASVALVSAAAIPEPQDAAIPTFTCGCTNACIIGCAGKPDCFCPQYCDPQYECPVPSTTTSYTPIKPTATCGCLNDCIVGCPDLRLCKCAAYCDPKYACPTTTPTKPTTTPTKPTTKPTKTTTAPPKPTFTCGCTNSCIIACAGKPNCICPQYCDPKYACTTFLTKKAVISLIPIPTSTGRPCGCYNDCQINCTKPRCICPAFCDPKYLCQS